jgi:hypothetical protein
VGNWCGWQSLSHLAETSSEPLKIKASTLHSWFNDPSNYTTYPMSIILEKQLLRLLQGIPHGEARPAIHARNGLCLSLHIISTKVSPNDIRINGLSYPMRNVMQESYKNFEEFWQSSTVIEPVDKRGHSYFVRTCGPHWTLRTETSQTSNTPLALDGIWRRLTNRRVTRSKYLGRGKIKLG